jgi:hypothetical protein
MRMAQLTILVWYSHLKGLFLHQVLMLRCSKASDFGEFRGMAPSEFQAQGLEGVFGPYVSQT